MRLASIPFGVALVVGALLLPRRAVPELVPVPVPDRAKIEASAAADHVRAERARRAPLSPEVRALGSAVRAFHTVEVHGAPPGEVTSARAAIDAALGPAIASGLDALLDLRAVQLEGFLAEVAAFRASGAASPELDALAGDFVRSMRAEGWCEGRALAPGETALRALYKHMWNAVLGLDARAGLAPALDEERAYYAFALAHPHPTRSMRAALEAARRGARDERACVALDEAGRAADEQWRLGAIAKLASIDPDYPADYARGVASFRRGDLRASTDAFRRWLVAHPDGPLALRAQNFLRGAAAAEQAE